ncbi:MAG: helix-turn-helix domain-containing protein [Haloarculaceae archaeon]
MSSIFPLREKVSLDDGREPRLVDLDDDVADDVFQALSSGTTRQIFSALHETPQTASDLADVTDTSVQNVQYHLKKLDDADLVETVDTWYSERGTEMKVYAPTDEALVLFAGRNKQSSLRALLKRVVGALALLLPMSAAVAFLARQLEPSQPAEPSGGQDPADPGAVPEATPTPDGGVSILDTNETVNGTTPTPTPENLSTVTDPAASGLDPALVAGIAFFLGGAFVLVWVGTRHLRR